MNALERVRSDRNNGRKMYWTAERTAHKGASADGWAIIHDPTPGGKRGEDGRTSYSLRFPALLICDIVSDPEDVAKELADYLEVGERISRGEE